MDDSGSISDFEAWEADLDFDTRAAWLAIEIADSRGELHDTPNREE